jgi:hypothetical protein
MRATGATGGWTRDRDAHVMPELIRPPTPCHCGHRPAASSSSSCDGRTRGRTRRSCRHCRAACRSTRRSKRCRASTISSRSECRPSLGRATATAAPRHNSRPEPAHSHQALTERSGLATHFRAETAWKSRPIHAVAPSRPDGYGIPSVWQHLRSSRCDRVEHREWVLGLESPAVRCRRLRVSEHDLRARRSRTARTLREFSQVDLLNLVSVADLVEHVAGA